MSRLLKKNATSRARGLGRVRACVRVLFDIHAELFANGAGAALAGSVAPIRSRHFAIAPSASSAITTTGPDDMYSQSEP